MMSFTSGVVFTIERIAVSFTRILENSRVVHEPPHALSASRQFARCHEYHTSAFLPAV
jgi:hypothetical protein